MMTLGEITVPVYEKML